MRSELGPTGQDIWDAYQADKLDAGSRTLVLSYARAADIADRLDGLAMARKEQWASLVFDDMGEVQLSVDKILDQARNQLMALKQLHGELRQAGIKATGGGKTEAKDEEPEDMLTRRRKEKEDRERKLG
jgi:hypothetical protein